MLLYKAWLESRARFFAAAAGVLLYCVWSLVRAARQYPIPELPALPYSVVVWSNLFAGPAPVGFIAIALILGLGGIQRERRARTASFTLALPVLRRDLLLRRVSVGVAQIVALLLIPVVLAAPLSWVLAGQRYSVLLAGQFALLYFGWSLIWFAVAILWSTLLISEYAAPVACLLTLPTYIGVADRLQRSHPELASTVVAPVFMTGEALVRPNTGVIVQPLPWVGLLLLAGIAALLVLTAVHVLRRSTF